MRKWRTGITSRWHHTCADASLCDTLHQVRACLVLEDLAVPLRSCVMRPGRDVAWGAAIPGQPPTCDPVWQEANEVRIMEVATVSGY